MDDNTSFQESNFTYQFTKMGDVVGDCKMTRIIRMALIQPLAAIAMFVQMVA